MKPHVLFVCLGNICRSPLAEAVFRAEAARQGLEAVIDSAGTGDWHVGEAPDARAQAVARQHGLDISGLRGRQVREEDFTAFDVVVAMDQANLAALRQLRPAGSAVELGLLLDYVPGRRGEAVADPYFGDAQGFERTWADVSAGAAALARRLRTWPGSPG